MTSRPIRPLLPVILLACWALPAPAWARTTLRNICRVRGQEEITLHGLGIVAGLDGTGDGGNFLPTVRSLATMMQLLGRPLGEDGASELKDAKNVALVIVTATIPAAGARRGDKIDCFVSAISAKSLAGGRLLLTPLTGPLPQQDPIVFAVAEGPITLEDETLATTARVHGGCRLEEDFFNPFSENGRVTLVVDKDYAGFQVTQEIAEVINTRREFQDGGIPLAKAIDQVNIEVTVPPEYRDHLVQFVSEILSLEMIELRTGPRVVIRERSGTIVIDGDVEIGPVLVTHKGVVVETGGAAGANEFVAVDSQDIENPKLKALLAALNAIRVPAEDKIEIIKALHRNGKLYAELIIE
jgi:flagellar P-ring protein precursor FlgI